MIEKLLIILLPLIFLGTFVTRNLIVKFRTKQKIKASDPLVNMSIVFSTLCVFLTMTATCSEDGYRLMLPIPFLRSPVMSYAGLLLFGISVIMGGFISAQLKQSWRVGVHENQKTDLIQTGIYAYSRNPYFFSYFIMFLGLFLIRPSFVIALLVVTATTMFHRMVLKEEAYLLTAHGKKYEAYKKKTGRYFPTFPK